MVAIGEEEVEVGEGGAEEEWDADADEEEDDRELYYQLTLHSAMSLLEPSAFVGLMRGGEFTGDNTEDWKKDDFVVSSSVIRLFNRACYCPDLWY